MGGGTDVAIETADAALLKSRVLDVAHLVALSRRGQLIVLIRRRTPFFKRRWRSEDAVSRGMS